MIGDDNKKQAWEGVLGGDVKEGGGMMEGGGTRGTMGVHKFISYLPGNTKNNGKT